MGKTKLGLPLEYQKLPEYFDAHNIGEDTELKNSVIERLLKKHQIKTVLDLTCGTGSQVFYLKKHNYEVTGADLSPQLLTIARDRATKEKLDTKFIAGDMRTLKVGEFDAVITIFNAIGHLTKPGFEKAIRNIHKNLKTGGIYIFDIFNLKALTDQVIENFAMHTQKKVKDTTVHSMQCSTIDRIKGLLTSYDTYMIQKNAGKPEIFNNKFQLQIYTSQELKEMLIKNGFRVLNRYGMNGEEFIEDKTLNMLTVSKKDD
ncbi:MAG: class I SAM-dependent methyltransferase [Sphingobacteriia bacterium]|nr:class I SAM-dependent methyltransferase [Sphingobacteriia bacterium]